MRATAIEQFPDINRIGGAEAIVSPYTMGELLVKAINGAGSTDCAAIATWLESAGQIDTIAGPFSVDAQTHFFPSGDSMRVIVKPHLKREGGLTERADCTH